MTFFILDVQRIDRTCLFRLNWEQTCSCSARIIYPETLPLFYQEWSFSYLAYYRSQVRARPGMNLTLPEITTDWRSRLIKAEADLLSEFQDWLRGKELYQIRSILAQAAHTNPVQLYIQCNDLALAKLPWETWQIEAEFNDQSSIQILRTAPEIVQASVPVVTRSRPRILAILGDDTGLDFQAERVAIQTQLRGIASVQFEGWGISPPGENLRARLCQAIADPRGWDVLFFAGHSNENGSGELMIAPDTALLVHELEDAIQRAKTNGLRCAIFNSCQGSKMGAALVNWGIHHVVIMREPIHNDVAQKFFERFAQQLAIGKDVCAATYLACDFLFINAKKNFQYPSASLIPSIYAYPDAKPYQFPQSRRWRWLKTLKPTWRDVICLSAIALLSGYLPLHHNLIDLRQLMQASLPQRDFGTPPVLLVQIDDASLSAAKTELNRTYLAKVVRHAIALKAPIVGVDYVVKGYQPDQVELNQVLQNKGSTQFVFGASATWSRPIPEIAAQGLGDVDLNGEHNSSPVFLARTRGDLSAIPDIVPFAHAMACLHSATCQDGRTQMQNITRLSAFWGQAWLNPWIDYSIAPQQVYSAIAAKDFLTLRSPMTQPIVLIAPGGGSEDGYVSPQAFAHQTDYNWQLTGGEIHAYMIQNLLQKRVVIPIPDLWMIGLTSVASKLLFHIFRKAGRKYIGRGVLLLLVPLIYSITSLGLYQNAAISLPIFFPILVYWAYFANRNSA
jgi:hypothetical protein